MTQHIELSHGDILHAGFTAPIQELLSGATVNFRLVVVDNTTIKIAPGEGDKQAGISVGGKYRYRSSETTATLPGSLANGEHPIFVTASANDFGGGTEEPDITTHTFGLEIKKSGQTPSTDLYREVGKVIVASEKIVGIRQTVGSVSGAQIENGALSGEGDLEWTREASGGWVPQLKANAVGASEIAEGAVGASEIAAGAVGESEMGATAKTLFPQLVASARGNRYMNWGMTGPSVIAAGGTLGSGVGVAHFLGGFATTIQLTLSLVANYSIVIQPRVYENLNGQFNWQAVAHSNIPGVSPIEIYCYWFAII